MVNGSGSRSLVGLLAMLWLVSTAMGQTAGGVRKKLIETGWDQPNTQTLRANLAQMEQRPFDGVVVGAVGRVDDKRHCDLRGAFGAAKWERAWFNNCVDDLRAARSSRLTDNFVIVGANPGNVDWFDDAGWANVVEHWRIAAWVAKQGGAKGLLFDPEAYTEPFQQFGYAKQAGHGQHTFEEYYAKARQRGREVMAAVAAEYPGITVFCYFMNVINAQAVNWPDPRPALEAAGYGLYPPFVDGWLDAVPPTVTIIDGCENAYMYQSTAQFLEAALLIKGGCQNLVSPENRAKYRAQVQVSFGLYLDAYWNEKPPYLIPALPGGTRVDRLRENAITALRVADEYVWVYGEQFRWWPTPNGSVKKPDWNEALPGCEDALRYARDPLDYGRARLAALRATGKLVDLARNGDFGSDKAASLEGAQVDWKTGGAPAGWSTWQVDSSKGAFTWDREAGAGGKGSARAARVNNGCFIQSYPVKPTERYLVRAKRRLAGAGSSWLRVRWQTPENKWAQEERDVIVPCLAPRGDWGDLEAVVTVPEGVGRLVLLLGMGGQQTDQDVAWFDDVQVVSLN